MKIRRLATKTDEILGLFELFMEQKMLREQGSDGVIISGTMNVDGKREGVAALFAESDPGFEAMKALKDLATELGWESYCVHTQ